MNFAGKMRLGIFTCLFLLAAAGSGHALTFSAYYDANNEFIPHEGFTTFSLTINGYDPDLYEITSAKFTFEFSNPLPVGAIVYPSNWDTYDQALLYDNDNGNPVNWWGQFLGIPDQDSVTMDLEVANSRLAYLDANSGADLYMRGFGNFYFTSASLTVEAVQDAVPTPEPATLWMLVIGGLGLLGAGPGRSLINKC